MENLASWGSSTEFCCGDRGLSNIHIWSVQGLLESEAKQYIMLFLLESVQLNVCFLFFICVCACPLVWTDIWSRLLQYTMCQMRLEKSLPPSWCPWTWTVSSTQSEIELLGVYSCSETLYVMKYCQNCNKNIVKYYETHMHKM